MACIVSHCLLRYTDVYLNVWRGDVYPNVWRGRCLPIISWMLFLCPVFRSPISTEIWDVFYSLNKETMWKKVTLIVWLLMDERHHISSSVFPLTVHFLKGEELEKKPWIVCFRITCFEFQKRCLYIKISSIKITCFEFHALK